MQHGVQAEQVGEEEGAHRRHLGVGDLLVDLLGGAPALVLVAPDLRGRRVQDPVDDEPGLLAAADRVLADLHGEVGSRLRRLLGRVLPLDHLDQPHHRGRIEEVEADHLVGTRRSRADLRDRQCRGVGSEDRVARRHLVDLREHRLLDLHPLGHRLDHEVHVTEALVLGGARDQAEDLLPAPIGLLGVDLLLFHQAGKLALGHLARLRQARVDELLLDVLHHHRHVRRGDHLGDLTAHRPGAEHRGLEYEHRFATLRSSERGKGYRDASGEDSMALSRHPAPVSPATGSRTRSRS